MGATHFVVERGQPYVAQRRDGLRVVAGRIDVVAAWRSGERLAIEIDRGHKMASVEKLRLARADGCKVLWLRWDVRNERRGEPPEDITTHWLKISEPKAPRTSPGWLSP